MNDTLLRLGQIGIVPVVTIEDAQTAVALGKALLDGGLTCIEITFRTATAADAIRAISSAYPDLLVGAGTVLTVDQAETAASAGAEFIVAPGFDAEVVSWCLDNDIAIVPGVMTPTDINQALAKGLDVVKFFPAEAAGGTEMLKAIGAPYANVKFIPTGGINASNLAAYLRLPMVHACGGSFMAGKELIAAADFETITNLARAAVAQVAAARSQ